MPMTRPSLFIWIPGARAGSIGPLAGGSRAFRSVAVTGLSAGGRDEGRSHDGDQCRVARSCERLRRETAGCARSARILAKAAAWFARIVRANRAFYPVATMCRLLPPMGAVGPRPQQCSIASVTSTAPRAGPTAAKASLKADRADRQIDPA